MRRVLTAAIAAAALTLTLHADEKPTEAYQKAMHDIGDAMQKVRTAGKEIEESGAGAQDYMPFEGATATMKTAFATALVFWQDKKEDDAIRLAQDAIKHAGDLQAAAKERDYRQVLDAMLELNQTCTSCHAAHRVRLPDGTLGIK